MKSRWRKTELVPCFCGGKNPICCFCSGNGTISRHRRSAIACGRFNKGVEDPNPSGPDYLNGKLLAGQSPEIQKVAIKILERGKDMLPSRVRKALEAKQYDVAVLIDMLHEEREAERVEYDWIFKLLKKFRHS